MLTEVFFQELFSEVLSFMAMKSYCFHVTTMYGESHRFASVPESYTQNKNENNSGLR